MVHLWVSDVTSGREYDQMNLLLVLFSYRAAAVQYIWDTHVINPAVPEEYTHRLLHWALRVPANLAYRTPRPDSLMIEDLTAFLIFLVDIARFPVFSTTAISEVCDWVDAYLDGKPRNPFAENPPNNRERLAIIASAQDGKPWTRPEFLTSGIYFKY